MSESIVSQMIAYLDQLTSSERLAVLTQLKNNTKFCWRCGQDYPHNDQECDQ